MMNKGASSNAITMDLIYVILSKLPIKSICRFLCVSKLWKSIICSQYFNELFHTMSSSNPRLLIFVGTNDNRWFFSSPQPQSSSLVVPSKVRTEFSGRVPYNYSYVCGLIYFPGDRHSIVCNPSTGGHVIQLPPDRECYGLLGYDPIGKQIKILIYKAKQDDGLVYHILTLGNENKRWREIKCPLTYHPDIRDHICINGILYYVVSKKSVGRKFIGCFDVRSETFKFLYRNNIIRYFYKLINYKGKLGGINWMCGNDDGNGFPLEIKMWVLEDVDKMEWKKYVYTVKAPENNTKNKLSIRRISVVGAIASGDIVLANKYVYKSGPFYVLYYNPERNTLRYVEIKDVSKDEDLISNYNTKRRFHYYVDHVENLGFDIMKTAYAESYMYEPGRTEESTSSYIE